MWLRGKRVPEKLSVEAEGNSVVRRIGKTWMVSVESQCGETIFALK